ncbi:MAG: cell division protein ZapA [Flavobacteriales bacterium]|nr:cell division protein ZapA [Flavobacteriales bacterium]|tara:strand:- start:13091 stop:13384 length:294 start_codon:yes stop_codon:yes gene_type:complete
MSESVSIKVNIAGKEYPLKITSSEREEVFSVESEINEKLKILKTDYGVKDKQDLLAMFLFQYMMANKKKNTDSEAINDGLYNKLKDLDEYISDYLKG